MSAEGERREDVFAAFSRWLGSDDAPRLVDRVMLAYPDGTVKIRTHGTISREAVQHKLGIPSIDEVTGGEGVDICFGGIGEAVMAALAPQPVRLYSLAVTQKPKTGKPAELLDYEEISRSAIVKLVKQIQQGK